MNEIMFILLAPLVLTIILGSLIMIAIFESAKYYNVRRKLETQIQKLETQMQYIIHKIKKRNGKDKGSSDSME